MRRGYREVKMVYFILNRRAKAFKIGISQDPKRRMRGLQSANADELEMLGVMDGGIEKEDSIHTMLWKYWIRGEWFKWCPETAYYLQGLGLDVKRPPIENVEAFLRGLSND